jgi:hypothetical protein
VSPFAEIIFGGVYPKLSIMAFKIVTTIVLQGGAGWGWGWGSSIWLLLFNSSQRKTFFPYCVVPCCQRQGELAAECPCEFNSRGRGRGVDRAIETGRSDGVAASNRRCLHLISVATPKVFLTNSLFSGKESPGSNPPHRFKKRSAADQ